MGFINILWLEYLINILVTQFSQIADPFFHLFFYTESNLVKLCHI